MNLAELQRLCHLRALEWLAWPAFLSQPVIPLLYIRFPVWKVLLAVWCAGWGWLVFRYGVSQSPAALRLATLGPLWVRVKWLTIPTAILVLLLHHQVVAAVVALATPLLVAFISIPGQVGRVETNFLSSVQEFVKFDPEGA